MINNNEENKLISEETPGSVEEKLAQLQLLIQQEDQELVEGFFTSQTEPEIANLLDFSHQKKKSKFGKVFQKYSGLKFLLM